MQNFWSSHSVRGLAARRYSVPDQQFCGTATLGDGYDVTAYVPTAAERAGNFAAFRAPIIDPLSNVPFPGNVIPESLLGQVYAWRIPSK